MSEQETWIGKIKRVDRLENETDSEYFERVTKEKWNDEDFTPESINEALDWYSLYDDYIYANNHLYVPLELKELCRTSFVEIKDNHDGTFSFYTSFYNGGTCLSEMIEEKLEKMGV